MKRKINRRRKKLSITKKVIIFALVLILLMPVIDRCRDLTFNEVRHNAKYGIVKEEENPYYRGKGQETTKYGEGYFTTFTTYGNSPKIYKEYKQNGDAPWSGNDYWDGTMADSGCGITAMSIVLSGYGMDYSPEDLRQRYYPKLDYDSLSAEFAESFSIDSTDFYFAKEYLNKEYIAEHLKEDKPIIACVSDINGANRWTTTYHYIVLLAFDGYDKFYVSNPNGLKSNAKSSGWYTTDEVLPYIYKAMFITE